MWCSIYIILMQQSTYCSFLDCSPPVISHMGIVLLFCVSKYTFSQYNHYGLFEGCCICYFNLFLSLSSRERSVSVPAESLSNGVFIQSFCLVLWRQLGSGKPERPPTPPTAMVRSSAKSTWRRSDNNHESH